MFMNGIYCFWANDPIAQQKAYDALSDDAILALDCRGLSALFLTTVYTQPQYKKELRCRAKCNPHFKEASARIDEIKKKFTVYCTVELEPPERFHNFLINGWNSHYWAHYFSRLLRASSDIILDSESRRTLVETLDCARLAITSEQVYRRIVDDLPVVFFSGYGPHESTPGHHTAMLFWGSWLILSDHPDQKSPFLRFYLYDRQKFTQETLQKIEWIGLSTSKALYASRLDDLLQSLQLNEQQKLDQQFILETCNGYQPTVSGLCHWYSLESMLLAFLLINREGKVHSPHELTIEGCHRQIAKAKAIHSEIIFAAALDRLERYVNSYDDPVVQESGLDGVWRRWVVAEGLAEDQTRWAHDGIWAQKCLRKFPDLVKNITADRNTTQFFEESLKLGLSGKSVEELLELAALRGDWQLLAHWISRGVNLQRIGPSGKSPLELLLACPSDEQLIAVLSHVKELSLAEEHAAAKHLATTSLAAEACYLVSRGISCREVDQGGFNAIFKMIGAAHHYAERMARTVRMNGDFEALKTSYHYFRRQGICMASGTIEPHYGYVMLDYWIDWITVQNDAAYEKIVNLMSPQTDTQLILERIQKGLLTPLLFIANTKLYAFVFYQGWLISLDPSIECYKIGDDEKSQSTLEVFIQDPQGQYSEAFDTHFDSEVFRFDDSQALSKVQSTLKNRNILGLLEGIYLVQDLFKSGISDDTTASSLIQAMSRHSENHAKRQHKNSQTLMRQYAIQDDLPPDVRFAVDNKFIEQASTCIVSKSLSRLDLG